VRRSDKERLEDMLVALERLGKLVKGKRDWVTIAAAERQLEILGEAAKGVSERLKEKHPEIPWPKLIKLRHEVIHEYFRLGPDRMWEAVERVLSFADQIKQILVGARE
jgi:uncharacterized protein with HEPN domain